MHVYGTVVCNFDGRDDDLTMKSSDDENRKILLLESNASEE